MKLWRLKEQDNERLYFCITDQRDIMYALYPNNRDVGNNGIDDLSSLLSIGHLYVTDMKTLSPDLRFYEVMVEGFNSIEELKALVPEEFI